MFVQGAPPLIHATKILSQGALPLVPKKNHPLFLIESNLVLNIFVFSLNYTFLFEDSPIKSVSSMNSKWSLALSWDILSVTFVTKAFKAVGTSENTGLTLSFISLNLPASSTSSSKFSSNYQNFQLYSSLFLKLLLVDFLSILCSKSFFTFATIHSFSEKRFCEPVCEVSHRQK